MEVKRTDVRRFLFLLVAAVLFAVVIWRAGMAWLSANAYSDDSANNLEDTECFFSAASEDIKLSIVEGIGTFHTNVAFAIVRPMHGRQLREFHRFANSRLDMFSLFGLDAFSPIMTGCDQGLSGGGEVAFVYQSKKDVESRGTWRSIKPSGEIYNGPNSFYDGAMKLLFMEQVTTPIAERFDASTAIMLKGRTLKPSFETAVEDLGIDKKKFDETFANDVFMRCFCGPFGIREETAKKILEHDVKDAELRTPNKRNAFRKLVYLDGREISEVVYWLWRRKGKAGEYAGFVKAHPELFEPIVDVSEFRTELGRRLLGTWK